ncbi:hypothetical protein ACOCG7_07085 [Paraburkholderia sp. DD10]|uniref:hypothetical protein n=1 Tax=Paraburkholderia sp. DD10 TaxID=3409691 RepID=UPI003BA2ACBD
MRIKARLSLKKTILAVAASMLTAVWHMLSDGAALIGVQTATRIDEAATAATDAARASPTYAVLAIVRELLQMPDDKRTSCATLAQIRDELVSASTRAGRETHNGMRGSAAQVRRRNQRRHLSGRPALDT